MLTGRWADMMIGGAIVLLLVLIPIILCIVQNCQRRRAMQKRRRFQLNTGPNDNPPNLFFIDPHSRSSTSARHNQEDENSPPGYLNYAYQPPTYEELVSQGALLKQEQMIQTVGGSKVGKQPFKRGEEPRVSLPSYDAYLAKLKTNGSTSSDVTQSGQPGTSTTQHGVDQENGNTSTTQHGVDQENGNTAAAVADQSLPEERRESLDVEVQERLTEGDEIVLNIPAAEVPSTPHVTDDSGQVSGSSTLLSLSIPMTMETGDMEAEGTHAIDIPEPMDNTPSTAVADCSPEVTQTHM